MNTSSESPRVAIRKDDSHSQQPHRISLGQSMARHPRNPSHDSPSRVLRMSRRQSMACLGKTASMIAFAGLPMLQAKQRALASNPRLTITDIEVHEITVPYVDWIAYELNHFYGPTRRTVYVVKTNSD
ncbi:MAG: hypothetical protein FJ267_20235, partial [Planctomycetes bacterium]|nr:hypothetical protein [Planctomycetota bacterium]